MTLSSFGDNSIHFKKADTSAASERYSACIQSDSLYNCSAWWCGPSYISHHGNFVCSVVTALNVPLHEIT